MNNRQHGNVPPNGQQYDLTGIHQLPDGTLVSQQSMQQ